MDFAKDNEVVAYLCGWFIAAVDKLNTYEEQSDFVLTMLTILENRLLNLPETRKGRNLALWHIYGLQREYWADREDWQKVTDIAARARDVVPPSEPNHASNQIFWGDAFAKLGRFDEAADAYLNGLNKPEHDCGSRGFLLLRLSQVVPQISDRAFEMMRETVTMAEYLQLPQLSTDRPTAAEQMKVTAFKLDPHLAAPEAEAE